MSGHVSAADNEAGKNGRDSHLTKGGAREHMYSLFILSNWNWIALTAREGRSELEEGEKANRRRLGGERKGRKVTGKGERALLRELRAVGTFPDPAAQRRHRSGL